MSELMELVDQLTVETRQVLHTETGPVIVRAAPLLGQLREVIRDRMQGAGGRSSSSSGSGAPLDLAALTVMGQVEDELQHLQWVARSTPGVLTPGLALGGMTVAERVRWTAGVLASTPAAEEMAAAARGWVRAIGRLFDPPKVVPLRRGAACPACGQSQTPILDPDLGEHVPAPALVVTVGGTPRADCRECGAEWSGEQVVDLAVQLGAPPSVAHLLAG